MNTKTLSTLLLAFCLLLLVACQAEEAATPTLDLTIDFLTELPIITVEVTEPILMCTPPSCADGEVYYCEGDCPGGCGTTCATVTPAPPSDDPTILPPTEPALTPEPVVNTPPSDWDGVEQWLVSAWNADMNHYDARTQLEAVGWVKPTFIDAGSIPLDFAPVDLSGDARAEWIVTLNHPTAPELSSPRGPVYAGNTIIIGNEGVIHRSWPTPESIDQTNGAPHLIGFNDLTGDGIDDAVIEALSCGVNTCYGNYEIMSYQHGYLDNLTSEGLLGRTNPHPTVQPYVHHAGSSLFLSVWMGDNNFDGFRQLEVWDWDGSQFVIMHTEIEDSGTGVPTDLAGLATWLNNAYQANMNPAQVRSALQVAGWQYGAEDWVSADFDGDVRDDWGLILYDPTATANAFGKPATFWVVTAYGIGYRQHEAFSMPDIKSLSITAVADVTGDGLPEVITNEENCGAHTCFQTYRVIGLQNGVLINLLVDSNQQATVINNSNTDTRFSDYNSDGRQDFLVHGGSIGSVGAGAVRTYTDVWAFSPDIQRMIHIDTVLDVTNIRYHYIYEANALHSTGEVADWQQAKMLYQAALDSDQLVDHPSHANPNLTSYDASRQWAAFRLAYMSLQDLNSEGARIRVEWLQTTYPDAAITVATAELLDHWVKSGSLEEACVSAETSANTYDNPTGALFDMGYGNPSLTADDLCP